MNNLNYIEILKTELLINAQALQDASYQQIESLLTQRATIKDLLIEALSNVLSQVEKAA